MTLNSGIVKKVRANLLSCPCCTTKTKIGLIRCTVAGRKNAFFKKYLEIMSYSYFIDHNRTENMFRLPVYKAHWAQVGCAFIVPLLLSPVEMKIIKTSILCK